jgi:hypothetical protein
MGKPVFIEKGWLSQKRVCYRMSTIIYPLVKSLCQKSSEGYVLGLSFESRGRCSGAQDCLAPYRPASV